MTYLLYRWYGILKAARIDRVTDKAYVLNSLRGHGKLQTIPLGSGDVIAEVDTLVKVKHLMSVIGAIDEAFSKQARQIDAEFNARTLAARDERDERIRNEVTRCSSGSAVDGTPGQATGTTARD